MNSALKKGGSIFLGLIIIMSLVYINMDSSRAANSIAGEPGSVWYDFNGNGGIDSGEELEGITVYLDNGWTGVTTASDGSFDDVVAAAPSHLDWDGLHYITFMADGFRTVTYNVNNIGGIAELEEGAVQMELDDSIYGQVRGTDGQPIAGVLVEALDYGTHQVVFDALGSEALARTDQFGNYVFKGLAPDTYDIRVSKDGEYVSQVSTAVRVYRGQTTDNIDFSLSVNYGALEGHVSDGNASIAGATVSIPGLGLSTMTDSTGYFRIDGIVAGGYTLTCEKDGYLIGVLYYDDSSVYGYNPSGLMVTAPFVQPGPPVTPVPADFNLAPTPLTPTTGYISGIVTDVNGNALEGAVVEIPGLELLGYTDLIRTTDKSGYYIFENVPNGEYDVVVTDPLPECNSPCTPGRLCHKTDMARVTVVPDLNADTDFALEENPGFLVGQVRDKDALPVADVAVSIPNSTISAITDVNGWYVLQGINAERHSLYDYEAGTVEYFISTVVVRASESSHYINTIVANPLPANGTAEDFYPFNIRIFPKTGTIKGIVSSLANGQGIEDAKVRVYGRASITNDDGMFEITNIPLGTYTVVADDNMLDIPQIKLMGNMEYIESRYDLAYKTGVPVTFGQETQTDFALADATTSNYGYVSGVAYEDIISDSAFNEGEGFAGATVEVPGYPTIDSDDFGFYIVRADDGMHNLVAYDETYEWYVAPDFVGITADSEHTGVDIEMVRKTGELIGNVSEQHPLTGISDPVDSATLWAPGYNNFSWYWLFTSEALANSDFFGNYAFANMTGDDCSEALTKGTHLIVTQKWNNPSIFAEEYFYEYEFTYVTIASTAERDISLTRETGRVEGQVWEDADGDNIFDYPTEQPLPDADVSLSKLYPATSDTSGYFTILDVPVTKDYVSETIKDPEPPAIQSNQLISWVNDPDFEINRYTGIAYLTGYRTETYESEPLYAYNSPDFPIEDRVHENPEYQFCNNIPVYEEVWYGDVTQNINFPLSKADPLPVTGSVSGYVDLLINDINAEAEVWIQSTDLNTWSDIEGFWIILGARTEVELRSASYYMEYGVDPSSPYYAIEAKKPHYVTNDTQGGIIFNVPVVAGAETDSIDFTLPKDGSIEGHVYEDVNRNGAYDPEVDVPIIGATVSIADLSVLSDSNGYYRIDDIYSNDPYTVGYVVSCTKDEYSFETIQYVDVDHGTGTAVLPPENIDADYSPFLLTKPEGLIIGRAVDAATMQGIAGIDVKAMDDELPTNEESVVTDDYGYYVFQSNRGTYTLQAPEVIVIDDCEALDGWSAYGEEDMLLTPGAMGYSGVMADGEDDGNTVLRLNKDLGIFDMSGHDFVTFYLKLDGEQPSDPTFQVDDGTEIRRWNLQDLGFTFAQGAWTKVTVCLTDGSYTSQSGDVDYSTIETMSVKATYMSSSEKGDSFLSVDHFIFSDTWVPKEIYHVNVTYVGATPSTMAPDAITRPVDFVLSDETTMPDNNVFGLVTIGNSTAFGIGESIVVSIPGLGLNDYPVAFNVTDPDGNDSSEADDNGDEHNFIFNDVPNDPGKAYTVVVKRAIPGTSPVKYMVEYATGVVAGTQVIIDLVEAPVTPYDAWLEGIVFWDMNENGVVDSNERLPDVDVYLPGSSPTNLPANAILGETTDSTGYYIINEIPSELNNQPTNFTAVARDDLEHYELGIQRKIPFMAGDGDWIDFDLEKTTSYDFAYLEGEVYFDANGNGTYDVNDLPNPTSEGIAEAIVTANPSQVTDSFGFFIFDDLDAEHTYNVIATATGYEDHNEHTFLALGDNFADYALDKLTNSISGYVFEDVDDSGDWSAGDLVIKAKVIAVKDGSETFEAYTDGSGYYFIPGIAQGEYHLQCVQVWDTPELPEYQDWVYADNPLVVPSDAPVTMDIAMSRYFVNVTGTVTGPNPPGTGIAGATICWYYENDGFTVPQFTAETESDGTWDLLDWWHDINDDGLEDGSEIGAPVGSWYVTFGADGYISASRWITLDYDDYMSAPVVIGPVALEPELDTGISGLVTDSATSGAVVGAAIKATDTVAPFDEFYATSGVGGLYTLFLEPGTYDIEATALGYDMFTSDSYVVGISGLETLDIEMVSSGGYGDITVVVDDPANYSGAAVTIWFKDVDDVYELAFEDTTDASGEAEFLSIPAGVDYYVCVSDNDNDKIMDVEAVTGFTDGDDVTVNVTLQDGTPSEIALTNSGWYLITPPVIMPGDVFWPAMLYASGIDMTPGGLESDMVARWNSATDSYEYYDATYSNAVTFDKVDADVGYWLHLTVTGKTFKVVGTESTSPRAISIPGGHWSLIGYTSLTDSNPIATNMAVNPTGAVNLMWTYDIPPTAAKLYDPYGRFTNEFENFTSWHAVWVYADTACTLTITTDI